jgi:hypothetical protein
MFKTQPFQNFNILYDSLENLAAKKRQYRASGTQESLDAYKAAKLSAVRAVSSQLVSAFLYSLMQFGWDAFRGKLKKYKDDDDELTLASWMRGIGLTMLSSAGGMLPYLSVLLEAGETIADIVSEAVSDDKVFDATFYGFSDVATGAYNDGISALIQLIKKTAKLFDEDSDAKVDESYVRSLINTGADVAMYFGIPAKNVINTFKGAANTFFKLTEGQYIGGYKALRVTSDPAKYSSDYYDLLYKAYKNGAEEYRDLLDMMMEDKPDIFTEDKIKNAMESREKKKRGLSSTDALNKAGARWYSPGKMTVYKDAYSALKDSDHWEDLDDDQLKRVLGTLNNIASRNESGKEIIEKIEATKSGLDETEYMLYQIALQAYDRDKLGSYTNAEKRDAILDVTGLTEKEQAALWEIAIGKEEAEKNPWSWQKSNASRIQSYQNAKKAVEQSSLWKSATPAQREKVTEAFSDLLRGKA